MEGLGSFLVPRRFRKIAFRGTCAGFRSVGVHFRGATLPPYPWPNEYMRVLVALQSGVIVLQSTSHYVSNCHVSLSISMYHAFSICAWLDLGNFVSMCKNHRGVASYKQVPGQANVWCHPHITIYGDAMRSQRKAKQCKTCLNAAGKHDCLPQAATLSICNDFFTRGVIYLRQSGWGDFEACAMVSQLALVQLSFHGFRTSGEGNKLQILQNDRASWQSSSANSQATFKNSIPYIRQRAWSLQWLWIEHEQQEFPSKQWLRKPAAVRPLDEANNGCWILRTRGSLRRMSCQVPSQTKSLPVSTCSNPMQPIHPQNQHLNVETLDLKAMWVQGPHVTVSSSQKNTVTSGDNGWT